MLGLVIVAYCFVLGFAAGMGKFWLVLLITFVVFCRLCAVAHAKSLENASEDDGETFGGSTNWGHLKGASDGF